MNGMKYLLLILALCIVFWYIVAVTVLGIVQGEVQELDETVQQNIEQIEAIRFTCNNVK